MENGLDPVAGAIGVLPALPDSIAAIRRPFADEAMCARSGLWPTEGIGSR